MTPVARNACMIAVILLPALPCLAQAAASESNSPTAVSRATGGAVNGSTDARIAALQEQVELQRQKINRLEAKVGLPTSIVGWTWFLIGLVGEGVFFLRFVVQWWASERKKRTVVPMAFWHLSLIGTGLVLAFAVFVEQPVFILAYSLNVFLYVRNLIIARRTPQLAALAEKESE